MNSPGREEIARDLVRAAQLPYGPERTAGCEQAVRLADLIGDAQLGFQARLHLIDAATFDGHPERGLVAFAWCMARHRENPKTYFNGYLLHVGADGRQGVFVSGDLLWRAKYVLSAVYRFAEISREQILDVFDQAKEVFTAQGRSLRPWYDRRGDAARFLGLPEESRHYRKLYEEAPRDRGADCEACERDDQVGWLLLEGREAEAVRYAAPLLAGRLSCETVPQRTIPRLLVPLLSLGRSEEARALHLRNWDRVRGKLDYLDSASDHIAYLALVGEDRTAVAELRRHLSLAEEVRETISIMDFYVMARLVLEAAKDVEVPEGFREEMTRRAREAVDALDRRNGNTWFREEAERYMKRLELRAR